MANFIGLLVAKATTMDSITQTLHWQNSHDPHDTPTPPRDSPTRIVGYAVYASAASHKCIAQAVEMAGLDMLLHFSGAAASCGDAASTVKNSGTPNDMMFTKSLRRIAVDSGGLLFDVVCMYRWYDILLYCMRVIMSAPKRSALQVM